MIYNSTYTWRAEEAFAARYAERVATVLGHGQPRWISLHEFDRRWLATNQANDPILYAGFASVTELVAALSDIDLLDLDDRKIARPWRVRACERGPLNYRHHCRCCLASYCRCRAPQNTHRV